MHRRVEMPVLERRAEPPGARETRITTKFYFTLALLAKIKTLDTLAVGHH